LADSTASEGLAAHDPLHWRRGLRPRLLRSPLTDRIYIVTKYTRVGDNQFIAHTKYEVTEGELSAVFLISIPEEDREKEQFELVIKRSWVQ
jgi:hypothetical protein